MESLTLDCESFWTASRLPHIEAIPWCAPAPVLTAGLT